MRTTLDLPDHLLTEIKIRAAKEHRKIKDVITEALEKGLLENPETSSMDKTLKIKPLFNAPFPENLTDANFNHLAYTLENEELLNKLTL